MIACLQIQAIQKGYFNDVSIYYCLDKKYIVACKLPYFRSDSTNFCLIFAPDPTNFCLIFAFDLTNF